MSSNKEQFESSFGILVKDGLISEPYTYDGVYGYVSDLEPIEEWHVWPDIKDYCQRANIPLSEIINNMRFNLLD
ncbi:hypothetical protein ABC345_20080 [Shouchella sp. 1P09AA]|uniref:hypothetical protein n=1 Tax=unclassified Shouchella TaxID=2893065 RepID=UPI0039A2074F